MKAQAAILRFSRAWAEASALALSQGKHAAEAVVRWFLGAVALGQAPRKTELEQIARAGVARWLGALPFGRVVGLFEEAGVVTESRGRKDSAKCAFASCVLTQARRAAPQTVHGEFYANKLDIPDAFLRMQR